MPRALALVLAIGGIALPGCATWWNEGPVDEPLLQSRQLTLEATYAAEQGNLAHAEELLAKAVATSANDVDARREYAELLWRQHRATEALVVFDDAVSLAPNNAGLFVRRGELQRELGMNAEARRDAERALILRPNDEHAWLLRARVASAYGVSLEAIECYQRVLGLNEDNREALHELSRLHWNQAQRLGPQQPMRRQMALASMQRLLERVPADEVTVDEHLLHASICRAMTRHEEALHSMQLAARKAPRAPHVLFQLAESQLAVGEHTAAFATASRGAELDPTSPLARELLDRIRLAAAPLRTIPPPGAMLR